MSKNIEININTNGSAYEPLYPKTLASNISAGTFTGSFTFGSVPSCSVNPSGTNHLVRKGWIDSQGYATQSWVNGQLGNVGSVKIKSGTLTGTGTVPNQNQVVHRIYVGFLPKFFYFGVNGENNGGVIDFDKSGTPATAKLTGTRDIYIYGQNLTSGGEATIRWKNTSLKWGFSYTNFDVNYSGGNVIITYRSPLNGAVGTEPDDFLNDSYSDYYWVAIGE